MLNFWLNVEAWKSKSSLSSCYSFRIFLSWCNQCLCPRVVMTSCGTRLGVRTVIGLSVCVCRRGMMAVVPFPCFFLMQCICRGSGVLKQSMGRGPCSWQAADTSTSLGRHVTTPSSYRCYEIGCGVKDFRWGRGPRRATAGRYPSMEGGGCPPDSCRLSCRLRERLSRVS